MPNKSVLCARLRLAVLLLMLCSLLPNAAAQKNELSGTIGRTFIANQGVPATGTNIHFGPGTSFVVSYGRQLFGGERAALSVEVPVLFNLDEDLNFVEDTVPQDLSAIFVTPAIRANLFPGSELSPWVSVGGGFGHFSESSNLVFYGTNPGKRGTSTSVFQVGAGLDVKLWRALSVRGELRDFDSGVPQLNVVTGKSRQHNIYVGAGVAWHF
jgi:Outer membrane protein beta-barrel domain